MLIDASTTPTKAKRVGSEQAFPPRRWTSLTQATGVLAGRISRTSETCVAVLKNRTVVEFDLVTGNVNRLFDNGWDKKMGSPYFGSVEYSIRGDHILFTSNEKVAREINLADASVGREITAHSNLVMSAVYSPNGKSKLVPRLRASLRQTSKLIWQGCTA